MRVKLYLKTFLYFQYKTELFEIPFRLISKRLRLNMKRKQLNEIKGSYRIMNKKMKQKAEKVGILRTENKYG